MEVESTLSKQLFHSMDEMRMRYTCLLHIHSMLYEENHQVTNCCVVTKQSCVICMIHSFASREERSLKSQRWEIQQFFFPLKKLP